MGTGTAAAVPAFELGRSVRLSRLSDELLARYAARGSERAFTALYERYHQGLYRYCSSILRSDADAQDALQATFAGAFAALRQGRRSAPLRPWLFRIAHNEAVSILRRRRREGESNLAIGAPPVLTPEESALERARWMSLMSDLQMLPERQRGALLLRELNGLSHEEIATALDTTVGGAKQAIFEARRALFELEEGRAMSCEEIQVRLSDGDRRVIRGRRVRAHLRECAACAAFASATSSRRAELHSLVPLRPPAAAAALLARSIHATSLPCGGGAAAVGATASGGTATAGIGGAGAVAGSAAGGGTAPIAGAAGTALATKALAGAALVAITAAGATGLTHVLQRHHPAVVGAPSRAHHAHVATTASFTHRSPTANGSGAKATATVGRAQAHQAGQPAAASEVTGNRNHPAGVANHGTSSLTQHGAGAVASWGAPAPSTVTSPRHGPPAQTPTGSSAPASGAGSGQPVTTPGGGGSQGSAGAHSGHSGAPGASGSPGSPPTQPERAPAGAGASDGGSAPGSAHAHTVTT